MLDSQSVLAGVSSALAAFLYAAFAFRLVRLGHWRNARGGAGWALLAAMLSSAVWGALGLAAIIERNLLLAALATLADLARYGSWYAFTWQLFRQPDGSHIPAALRMTMSIASAMWLIAMATQGAVLLGVELPGIALQLHRFSWMACPCSG